MTKNILIATALALIAVTCWSGNFIIGRAIRADITPISLSFWRWMGASILLFPFAFKMTQLQWKSAQEGWLILAGLALTGAALFQTMTYIGLRYTEAINGLLILTLSPLVIIILAFFFLKDRISLKQLIGIAISLLGAVFLICRGELERLLSLTFNLGDIWILGAVIVWGFYSILLKYKPADVPPMMVVFFTAIGGVLMLLPLYLWEIYFTGFTKFSLTNIGAILYTAIFASILAFSSFNAAVQRIGPSKTIFFLNMMPVVGSILAVIILGERFEIYHWIGFPLAIFGVFLATLTRE